jgi:4-hydroxybenzoate polyprenyltransferase
MQIFDKAGKTNLKQIRKSPMSGNLKSILLSIRYRESLIFQSPTLMGLVMFLPDLSFHHVVEALYAGLGSFLVMASIFAVNDWADIDLDSQNTLKRNDTFLKLGIGPRQMLGLVVSLAAGGIILFAVLSRLHLLIALGAIAFGLAYSVPVQEMRGKNIPVFSSLLHFGGTLLSFLLGALTFAPADWHGLLVALHPAILITAGHLVHEVEDYEQDQLALCQTNAVRFGRKPVFILASLLFSVSFLLLYYLVQQGFFPAVIKYTSILYLAYLVPAIQSYRSGLTRDSVQRLQRQYRILFAAIVLIMLVGSLFNNWILW